MKKQVTFLVQQQQQQKQALRDSASSKDAMRKQYEEQLKDLRQKKLKVETSLQDVSGRCFRSIVVKTYFIDVNRIFLTSVVVKTYLW